jgi:ribonuclease Z
MIRVTFLGTSASRPTVGRNVSAVALQREGVTLLFDCGEGTQRQMMRYGTGFAVDHIFISHLHADHYLGVIGLLRTLSLQGRTETLHLYGPAGSRRVLEIAIELGGNRMSFPIEIRELSPGHAVDWDDFAVEAVAVRHGVPAVGYALRERPRAGRFNVEAARTLGVPEGPLFGRLHRGETIEWGGRKIEPRDVVGAARPGRLVVFTGDTRPAEAIADSARGADLLIHDCTFGDEGEDRARETFHSTAREAAGIAARAGVKRLYLTHVSARYSANAEPLLREAREVFVEAEVAFDGLTVEIEYPGDEQGSGST